MSQRRITSSTRVRYYREAADFWLQAVHLQKGRLLPEGEDSDEARADLNFFVVAIQRLREVARQMDKRLKIEGAKEALEKFDGRWPRLKDLRNHEEHVLGPTQSTASLPGVYYFGPFVADLGPGGTVEYLVDARYMDSDVGELYESIHALLVLAEQKASSET